MDTNQGEAYEGWAKRYPGGVEVNHPILIEHLRTFDGFVLSCKTNSLARLLPLCPPRTRVLSWVKNWAVRRPNVWPSYAWEPVLLLPLRHPGRDRDTPPDWCVADTRNGQSILGEKPATFCVWLFRCAGLLPEDSLVDLFPGSGAVSRAWEGVVAAETGRPLQLCAPLERKAQP